MFVHYASAALWWALGRGPRYVLVFGAPSAPSTEDLLQKVAAGTLKLNIDKVRAVPCCDVVCRALMHLSLLALLVACAMTLVRRCAGEDKCALERANQAARGLCVNPA